MKKVTLNLAINANLDEQIIKARNKYNYNSGQNLGKYEMVQKLLEIGAGTILKNDEGDQVIF
jgi:hypothetical protein